MFKSLTLLACCLATTGSAVSLDATRTDWTQENLPCWVREKIETAFYGINGSLNGDATFAELKAWYKSGADGNRKKNWSNAKI